MEAEGCFPLEAEEVCCSLWVSELSYLGRFGRVELSLVIGYDAAARAWSVGRCLKSRFLGLGVRRSTPDVLGKSLRTEALLQMSSGSGSGAVYILN